jgi:hypothetical protein
MEDDDDEYPLLRTVPAITTIQYEKLDAERGVLEGIVVLGVRSSWVSILWWKPEAKREDL